MKNTTTESNVKIDEATNDALEKAIASMLEYLTKEQVLDYVKKIIDYVEDEKQPSSMDEITKKQWQYKAGILK